jgi:hypothetical protein
VQEAAVARGDGRGGAAAVLIGYPCHWRKQRRHCGCSRVQTI